MIITGEKEWRREYRNGKHKQVWIIMKVDGQNFFLEDFEDYLLMKEKLDKQNSIIESIGLQYKSHAVEQSAKNSDGVYLIRSVKGNMGGESIDTYTTGIVNGNKVKKTMWSVPALVPEGSYEDNIEDCFAEAIIYNDKKKT